MGRLLLRLTALCLVVWGGLALAQAPEETVFGPKTYNHPSAPPTEVVDSFTLPAGIAGPFTLKVWNGESDGQERVEAAWILLNGVQVAGPNDFDRKTFYFERALQVSPQNQLTVKIHGRPGTKIRVGITGVRILPVPTALSPNPLSVTVGG